MIWELRDKKKRIVLSEIGSTLSSEICNLKKEEKFNEKKIFYQLGKKGMKANWWESFMWTKCTTKEQTNKTKTPKKKREYVNQMLSDKKKHTIPGCTLSIYTENCEIN